MICIDGSVAAKWLFPEEYSLQALTMVEDAIVSRERIVAPSLLPIEITNIVRQRMRQGTLDLQQAQEDLARFFTFRVHTINSRLLHQRALAVTDRYNLPAAYVAHYVDLAELSDATLWTDDRRLLRILGGKLPLVRWIAEYST